MFRTAWISRYFLAKHGPLTRHPLKAPSGMVNRVGMGRIPGGDIRLPPGCHPAAGETDGR